jgi:uncharacterized protein (UPF0333 family)
MSSIMIIAIVVVILIIIAMMYSGTSAESSSGDSGTSAGSSSSTAYYTLTGASKTYLGKYSLVSGLAFGGKEVYRTDNGALFIVWDAAKSVWTVLTFVQYNTWTPTTNAVGNIRIEEAYLSFDSDTAGRVGDWSGSGATFTYTP